MIWCDYGCTVLNINAFGSPLKKETYEWEIALHPRRYWLVACLGKTSTSLLMNLALKNTTPVAELASCIELGLPENHPLEGGLLAVISIFSPLPLRGRVKVGCCDFSILSIFTWLWVYLFIISCRHLLVCLKCHIILMSLRSFKTSSRFPNMNRK